MPLSQLYKLFLFALLVYLGLKKKVTFIVSFSLLFYGAVLFLHVIFITDKISETFLHLSKFLLFLYTFLYFRSYSVKEPIKYIYRAMNILKINSFVLVLNILLGLVGVGFHTYPNEQIGFKGFFYAGNELAGIISVLFPFLLFIVYRNYSKIKYILCSLFLMAISILIGTKSTMIISLISVFFIVYAYGTIKERISVVLIVFFALIMVGGYGLYLFNEMDSDIVDRWMYSYDKGGFIMFFLSSRDEFLAERTDAFFNGGFWIQLLGLGGNRTVEMDPFDALINYGYLGLFLIYSFVIYLLIRSYKLRKSYLLGYVVLLVNCLIFFISLFAGHIFFSGMNSLFIALVNSLSFYNFDKLSSINEKKYSYLKFVP